MAAQEAKTPEPVDGRRARGEENRRRIVAAFIDIIRRGGVSPTAEEIAARAAVGLRTVFRHFEDMELLYREIAAVIEAPIRPIVEQPFVSEGWRGRLSEIVERRAEVYERIMPFKIAGIANAHRSPFLRRRQRWFARMQRQLLLDVVPELAELPPPLLDALDMMLGFEAWAGLRRERKLDVAAAKAAITAGTEALTGGLEP
ncbi:MAG: TetR/AcrR family transcriptional regulator [Alphaproteobacteria bacterium]|nr:TetR/AcrR family transcriptional regulator [Alphaproteobacteria bacterium]